MPARKHHRRHSRSKATTPTLKAAEKVEADSLELRLHGAPLPDKNKPTKPISPGAVEAKMFMEKARLAFEAKQQGKEMTGIAAALKIAMERASAAQNKETPEPKIHQCITTNVTRSTFNYIRDNPALTRVQVVSDLVKQGYNRGSVSSLVGQMIVQRLVRDESGGLHVNQREYTPLSQLYPKYRTKPKATPKRSHVRNTKPVEAEVVVEAEKPTVYKFDTPKAWEPKDVIDNLTLHQAIALYKELRNTLVG